MTEKQEILSVRMPADLAAGLRKLAAEQGGTVSDVLRDAAMRAVRDAEPCAGLCSLQRTVTGSGFSAPVDLTWKCGCGAPIPATVTIS